MNPIYGLTESGDYWTETLRTHHIKLNMISTPGDLSRFFKRISNRLLGISCSNVDGILRACTHQLFEDSKTSTRQNFQSKDPESPPIEFAGLLISREKHSRRVSQRKYIKRLKPLTVTATSDDIRSIHIKISWVFNNRPNICASVANISQVTKKNFDLNVYKLQNNTICRLKESSKPGLNFPRLVLMSLYLLLYSDASINSLSNQRS